MYLLLVYKIKQVLLFLALRPKCTLDGTTAQNIHSILEATISSIEVFNDLFELALPSLVCLIHAFAQSEEQADLFADAAPQELGLRREDDGFLVGLAGQVDDIVGAKYEAH